MIIDSLLSPIDAANPSGTELRNDARFHALERQLESLSRESRQRQIDSGNTGAVDLDWAQLLADAAELAASGRDLRLLVIVARLQTNEEGLAGLSRGLGVLAETVTRYWDTVHPMLRDSPSKRESALRRINALYQIENADSGILGDLEFATLLSPRGLGPITGGDLAVGGMSRAAFLAEGPTGLGDKELADLIARHEARVNRVKAACRATAAERPEEMAALIAAVKDAETALAGLEAALAPHVTENDTTVKFAALAQFLSRVGQTLASEQTVSAENQTTPAPAEKAEAPAMNGASPPAAGTPPPGAASTITGAINSRRDVEKCLDQIIDFYERTEPSSPIPHLARRMRKMVPMNFMQLMEEIAPSGMKEFRGVAGVFDEKTK